MSRILLDMNNPHFQKQLFGLEKNEKLALLNSLGKMSQLSWEQLYKDKGIRWELINSMKTPKGKNIYSFRFSQKYRGLAFREENYLVLVDLFVDHDGAYK